jgi:uncharacterized membrane protein YeaQ/YmgE (transglycosylase-associated protein family)
MNFIAWIVSTAVIAWLASVLMRSELQNWLALDLVIGVLGSALGHWALDPLALGLSGQDLHAYASFGLGSALSTFFGALVLLALLNLVRKGRMR